MIKKKKKKRTGQKKKLWRLGEDWKAKTKSQFLLLVGGFVGFCVIVMLCNPDICHIYVLVCLTTSEFKTEIKKRLIGKF